MAMSKELLFKKETLLKWRIQELANSIASEKDIYYLDVDFLQEPDDIEPPSAIPMGDENGLLGVVIKHVCEINGEVFTYDREVECEFPNLKEAS